MDAHDDINDGESYRLRPSHTRVQTPNQCIISHNVHTGKDINFGEL